MTQKYLKFIAAKYSIFNKRKKLIKMKGNKVYCPICNNGFKYFLSAGYVNRENALCPACGSLERHRLIWKYIQVNNFIEKKKIRLLHFAPERFFYKKFANLNYIEYYPCDIFPEKFKFRSSVKIHEIDITTINFDDNYFDFILCNHVLEHIPDDIKAMSELFRVMKPGGKGIFQVPINYNLEKTFEDSTIMSPSLRLIHFGQEDHVRIYGTDYIQRLESVGFNVKEDKFVEEFSISEQKRYGFLPSELIYFTTK